MSFGGSVSAMISSIRNNKALIGQRRSYFDNKIALEEVSDKMKISYQKATPEQLRLVRAKLKRQRVIHRIKTFVVLLILSPIIFYAVLNMWSAIAEEIPKSKDEILMEYYADIKKGDEYLRKRQYNNAMTLYWRAEDIKPYTHIIDYRMALTLTYKCLLLNENCGRARWKIKYLLKKDTTDTKLIRLNELLSNPIIKINLHR